MKESKVVDKKVVIDYVNSLHPAQQMFVINYKYNLTTENSVENSVENNVENSVENNVENSVTMELN